MKAISEVWVVVVRGQIRGAETTEAEALAYIESQMPQFQRECDFLQQAFDGHVEGPFLRTTSAKP